MVVVPDGDGGGRQKRKSCSENINCRNPMFVMFGIITLCRQVTLASLLEKICSPSSFSDLRSNHALSLAAWWVCAAAMVSRITFKRGTKRERTNGLLRLFYSGPLLPLQNSVLSTGQKRAVRSFKFWRRERRKKGSSSTSFHLLMSPKPGGRKELSTYMHACKEELTHVCLWEGGETLFHRVCDQN